MQIQLEHCALQSTCVLGDLDTRSSPRGHGEAHERGLQRNAALHDHVTVAQEAAEVSGDVQPVAVALSPQRLACLPDTLSRHGTRSVAATPSAPVSAMD